MAPAVNTAQFMRWHAACVREEVSWTCLCATQGHQKLMERSMMRPNRD